MIKRALFALGGLLLLALLLLPSLRVSAASSQAPTPLDGFKTTCGAVSVDSGGVLHATCLTNNDTPKKTSLDLNSHIGNINGQLTPNRSGFVKSCGDIGGGVILSADCFAINGDFAPSLLNLNSFVSNRNGVLVWG